MSRMLKALEQLQSRGVVAELIMPVEVPLPPAPAAAEPAAVEASQPEPPPVDAAEPEAAPFEAAELDVAEIEAEPFDAAELEVAECEAEPFDAAECDPAAFEAAGPESSPAEPALCEPVPTPPAVVETPVVEAPRQPAAQAAPRARLAAALCEMAAAIDTLPEVCQVAPCSEMAFSIAELPEPIWMPAADEPAVAPVVRQPAAVGEASAGKYDALAAELTARLSGGSAAAVALLCIDRTDPLGAMIVPLAGAIAACAGPVLVVDCDVREPSLSDRFATSSEHGLLDLLPGPARWQEVIRPTQFAGVDLLPGRRPVAADGPVPDRLDLEPLVYEWLDRYRLVLLAAGTLARPETRSLLRCVHGAVLILEASRTTEDAARRAARTIRAAGAHLVGTILVEAGK